MEDKKLIIPIDQIKADFSKFLSPEHNRRIIFSGPFGIGKTYFMHNYFDSNEAYFPIFLRPINYSLLSNEDVFRFIKYDILCQLVENEKFDIEDSFDFTDWDYTKLFLGQNGFAILFNLLKYMPKIGTYVRASQKMGILVEKFQEGLKSFNENKDLKLLKEFGEQTENHFLFENDGVTEFISQQLEKIVSLQSEEEKMNKVLVIDDLDRLDPEHIFRLFNVFSAHFDQVKYYENPKDNDNKFGFDKVIFVCDIENIRKIFAHKYGSEVDFSGYIDKFYSTEIYSFLHDDVFEGSILPYLEKKLNTINSSTQDLNFIEAIKLIIRIFFSCKQLNIREIIRLKNLKSILNYDNEFRSIVIPLSKVGAKTDSLIIHYNFLLLTKLLIDLIGDKTIFYEKLKRVSSNLTNEKNFNCNNYTSFICELIMFAKMDLHKFSKVRMQHSVTKKDEEEYIFLVKILGTDVETKCEITAVYETKYMNQMWFSLDLNKTPSLNLIQFFKLYLEACQRILDESLI